MQILLFKGNFSLAEMQGSDGVDYNMDELWIIEKLFLKICNAGKEVNVYSTKF
jgi:hypothetical protein